ncbi:hypothetical protein A9Q79_08740 [Methylophaga sp. 42_25_T18]|nr:hypothetical protein A9Q79_08740 [Methylophaga sp. 42_25_T18]
MNLVSRQYIRHPVAIPIHVAAEQVHEDEHHQVKDISAGGLCFVCANHFQMGDKVQITISICHPEFNAEGIVRWCKKNGNNHLIGVVFVECEETAYSLRMVEQICHIENYRQEMIKQTGEEMSSEKAAMEWIQKFASEFPNSLN